MAELVRLENKKGSCESARRMIDKAASKLNSSNSMLAKDISDYRRSLLEKLEGIEQESRRVFKIAEDKIAQDDEAVRGLSDRVVSLQKAAQGVLNVEGAKKAAVLMSQAKIDFAAIQNDPEYVKFGSDMIASIASKLDVIDRLEQSSSSLQMQATRLTGEIYETDLTVSKRKIEYERLHLQALGLAEQISSEMDSLRKNTYYNPETKDKLVDFDYWTDQRFGELEQEVKEIVDRIERVRSDPSYTTSTLKRDFERLRELNQIKDITAADAMETIALSDARREMAQIVSDIMCQEHRFSIVGEGFDGLDMREAYIIRMKRYIDDAEVEIIVSPNKEKGENDLYYRINNQCYTDEQTMNSVYERINQELYEEYGIESALRQKCHPEPMEPFNPARPCISEQTRRRHQIESRK
jgi:hypothetical protein